jgi:hypothetical protein
MVIVADNEINLALNKIFNTNNIKVTADANGDGTLKIKVVNENGEELYKESISLSRRWAPIKAEYDLNKGDRVGYKLEGNSKVYVHVNTGRCQLTVTEHWENGSTSNAVDMVLGNDGEFENKYQMRGYAYVYPVTECLSDKANVWIHYELQ